MGEADSIASQLLVAHLLYTVQDLFGTARQSSFQKSFHALLIVFLVDPVSASQIKTDEEILWVKPANSITDQLLVTHLLYTVKIHSAQ